MAVIEYLCDSAANRNVFYKVKHIKLYNKSII